MTKSQKFISSLDPGQVVPSLQSLLKTSVKCLWPMPKVKAGESQLSVRLSKLLPQKGINISNLKS